MLLIPQVTLNMDHLKQRSRISDHYSIFCITDIGIKMQTTTFMKKKGILIIKINLYTLEYILATI